MKKVLFATAAVFACLTLSASTASADEVMTVKDTPGDYFVLEVQKELKVKGSQKAILHRLERELKKDLGPMLKERRMLVGQLEKEWRAKMPSKSRFARINKKIIKLSGKISRRQMEYRTELLQLLNEDQRRRLADMRKRRMECVPQKLKGQFSGPGAPMPPQCPKPGEKCDCSNCGPKGHGGPGGPGGPDGHGGPKPHMPPHGS